MLWADIQPIKQAFLIVFVDAKYIDQAGNRDQSF